MTNRDIVFLSAPVLFVAGVILGKAANETVRVVGFGSVIVAMALFFILWLTCLASAVRMEDKGNERTLWLVVILFTGVLGMYMYYLKVMRKSPPPERTDT